MAAATTIGQTLLPRLLKSWPRVAATRQPAPLHAPSVSIEGRGAPNPRKGAKRWGYACSKVDARDTCRLYGRRPAVSSTQAGTPLSFAPRNAARCALSAGRPAPAAFAQTADGHSKAATSRSSCPQVSSWATIAGGQAT